MIFNQAEELTHLIVLVVSRRTVRRINVSSPFINRMIASIWQTYNTFFSFCILTVIHFLHLRIDLSPSVLKLSIDCMQENKEELIYRECSINMERGMVKDKRQ